MAKFDSCTGRRGAFGGTSAAAVAAITTRAARRMLGFVGELLRVRRTRLSPSSGVIAALRPAFLRLKALSFAKRFWRPGAACNSSVSGLGGRRWSGETVTELATPDDGGQPSLRQQSPASAILRRACGRLRA